MKTAVTIVVDANSSDLEKCLEIRRIVFIEGQNVPESLEIDGLDKESTHYLISVDNFPIGTARVRYVDTKAKIERVAILPEYQGCGFGKKLMQFIVGNIQSSKTAKTIVLSSQVYAIPFYESLGFTVCSDEYMDADIPHKNMEISI
jgi:predicted GNAT family N-acyltransferase